MDENEILSADVGTRLWIVRNGVCTHVEKSLDHANLAFYKNVATGEAVAWPIPGMTFKTEDEAWQQLEHPLG